MGRLTTHVLDTMAGTPAAGLDIELWTAGEGARRLKTVTTNADGRVDAPLLEGEALCAGRYELRFRAGAYLRTRHGIHADILFLDEIPVRFGIADPDQHCHVPLLLSAYGYSTYRGS
jgi:5-hydroxyisourate hydrolase